MLSSLKINDVAIIEEAKIEYEPGLNIMTGETGSGKSIIIDSINAVLGERTSKELIRDGADCARVSAVFDNVSGSVLSVLDSYGIDCEDGSIFIQRVIKDGKNLCKINGEAVTAAILKAVGKHLINIHGQNDSQALLNKENHITYIDKWANNFSEYQAYFEKYNRLKQINRELKKCRQDENEKERKLDNLSYQINEIESANIKIGERDELLELKKVKQNEDRMRDSLINAKSLLDGDGNNEGLTLLAYDLSKNLAVLSSCYNEASEHILTLNDSISFLNECSSFINNALDNLEGDGIDINTIEERLDLIYRLSKKYGENEEEICKFLENAKKEYDNILLNSEKLEKLENEYNTVLDELVKAGNELTKTRIRAGEDFSQRIMKELSFLNMPDVKFSVKVEQCAATSNGLDDVEFLISANLGQASKPLAKIASGGELSRIMLAIKCVLSDLDDVDTLVFDEIDSGVSGRAAEKIGIKLKEVSSFSQVICVTHLAQIACFADNHLYIEKNNRDNKTFTDVKKLDFEARKREIARIIGGSLITEATLLSAEEMLQRSF